MTRQISVSNTGEKTYNVVKNVPRPTTVTRERDSAKAKYAFFNTMEDNDYIWVATPEERAAVTQAFNSKVYSAAAERGYLFTRDLSKANKVTQLAAGKDNGFGIWFTAYTTEERVANAIKVGEKA